MMEFFAERQLAKKRLFGASRHANFHTTNLAGRLGRNANQRPNATF